MARVPQRQSPNPRGAGPATDAEPAAGRRSAEGWSAHIHGSPRMVAQRRHFDAVFGTAPGESHRVAASDGVLQRADYKAKADKKHEGVLKKLDGGVVTLRLTDADVVGEDLLVPINAAALAMCIVQQLNVADGLVFTMIPSAIKRVGDHTLTIAGKTLTIKVTAPAKVLTPLELAEQQAVADKAHYTRDPLLPPLAEPVATPEDSPQGALFGTEFTFSNDKMFKESQAAVVDGRQHADTPETLGKQREWVRLLLSKRPPGLDHVEALKDKSGYPVFRFTYADGFWYQCSIDIACIETQTFKMSLGDAQSRGWLLRLRRDIFDIAAELSLRADPVAGGGHLHLDIGRSFGNDPRLFRAFLVDFCNNPLALEVLENDPTNSPVMAQLAQQHRTEFASVIKKFDLSLDHYKGSGAQAIQTLALDIEKRVYKGSSLYDPAEKYQALNLRRILDTGVAEGERTLEIRSIRAQRSVAEFVLIARLLRARIAMLKAGLASPAQPDAKLERSAQNSDAKAVLEAFRQYVEGAKLAWSDYEPLARANLAERTPGKKPAWRAGDGPPRDRLPGSGQRGEGIDPLVELLRRQQAENRIEGEVGPYDLRYGITEAQIGVLRLRGLRLTGTVPDGDCSFNSISESAGLGLSAAALRERAAVWCEQNREMLLGKVFVDVDEPQRAAAFDEAVKMIRATEARAFLGHHGDMAMLAMCALAGRGVQVLQPSGAVVDLSPGAAPVLLVLANGPMLHYYGTRP